MTAYGFQPFLRQENSGKEFAIPEITDGFLAPGESDAAGDAPEITAAVEGMVPVSFMTEELPRGTYRVQITLRALDDVEQLRVFAGRKQLRAVVSLKKGEEYRAVYYQHLCEIIPRWHTEEWTAKRLFVSYAARNSESISMEECSAAPAENVPVVWLCGDSTVTDQAGELPYNSGACYASWGQALPAFLDGTAVENQAHCGLTTESFREEGHFDIVMRHIRKGDFCLFQFGHNDQKLPHLMADTGYYRNLVRFVDEVRQTGAQPVLVTPLGRNIWKKDGSYNDLLSEYAKTVVHVAKEKKVPCIDLHGASVCFLNRLGMADARGYFHPGDYTHTNEYGAYRAAAYIAEELARLFPDIFPLGITGTQSVEKFIPEPGLWEKLSGKGPDQDTSTQRELFDKEEKDARALLAAIESAKEAARR
ncbi:MAG TPA: rhamnogalacturonan acetylesterase [Candidatus Mediterraneibacter cottocaccae]|nr:rhamnogalacturonan acetylesterase [Candidatus Mediterraneibacter cottocaccae]